MLLVLVSEVFFFYSFFRLRILFFNWFSGIFGDREIEEGGLG